MSKRNPDNNPILQAALDVIDCGYGSMTFDQFVTRLSSDRKLREEMKAKWNGHSYPEKSLTWTQHTIDQHVFKLSDTAFKVLNLLGMYCHQNGLIQIKKADIMATLNIKKTTLKQALAELIDCGAIRVELPSAQHSAPVYAVNPALINKGARRKTDVSSFVSKLDIPPNRYLFNQEVGLSTHVETIYSNNMPTFNRFNLVSAQKKGPATATVTDPRSDKSNPQTNHKARKQKPSTPEGEEGQMTIFEWLGADIDK